MNEQTFQAGGDVFVAKESPSGEYSAVFEDNGETGYFYAVEFNGPKSEMRILDAVHIYDVANVVDRDRPSTLSILWSEEGSRCALLINRYAHAVFDFAAKRGYCRTNFPNFPSRTEEEWSRSDHSWSEDAVAWLHPEETIS